MQPQTGAPDSIKIENIEQFIIRFPTVKEGHNKYRIDPSVTSLHKTFQSLIAKNDSNTNDEATTSSSSSLFIKMDAETRRATVKYDNQILDARLVDLPCIIETLDTIDNVEFYKTGEISQMLVCKTKDDPWISDNEEESPPPPPSTTTTTSDDTKKKKKKPLTAHEKFVRKYQWPHGITPPLKNVRRKRFRKVAKKKYIDYAEIEKEVKQLFRADRDALDVEYQVSYVDQAELEEENDDLDDDPRNDSSLFYNDDDDDLDDFITGNTSTEETITTNTHRKRTYNTKKKMMMMMMMNKNETTSKEGFS
jgi:TATA-binding protein-associated factor Taf7